VRRAAAFLVAAYGLMLLVVGAVGIFSARWELNRLFGIDLGEIGSGASFANQYSFLKGVELGAGSFCLLLRRDILAGGAAGKAFIVLVAGGVFARALAWALEGRPSVVFIIFLLLEVLVLVVYLLRPRDDHAR
jgi:hypothetical protein